MCATVSTTTAPVIGCLAPWTAPHCGCPGIDSHFMLARCLMRVEISRQFAGYRAAFSGLIGIDLFRRLSLPFPKAPAPDRALRWGTIYMTPLQYCNGRAASGSHAPHSH